VGDCEGAEGIVNERESDETGGAGVTPTLRPEGREKGAVMKRREIEKLTWTVPEVAEMTGLSDDHIRRKIVSGELSEIRRECKNAAAAKSDRPLYLVTAKGIEKLTGVRPALSTGELVEEVVKKIKSSLLPEITEIIKNEGSSRSSASVPTRDFTAQQKINEAQHRRVSHAHP